MTHISLIAHTLIHEFKHHHDHVMFLEKPSIILHSNFEKGQGK